ncbi:MAG TPA: hypothetical protein VN938_04570 [Xanthobacteraceae bacterium]|jgi:hypothetical protein|nr:hypothetical protein [Xanthobacteraceae bacterium]
MFPDRPLIALLLLVLLVSAATLQGLAASGHFPLRDDCAKPAFRSGRAILFSSIGVALLALVAGTIAALRLTSWSAAIIAGGLSLLFAPLVLRAFPNRFVDGAGALVSFAAATVAAAVILIWLAG